MNVIVNGESRSIKQGASAAELLRKFAPARKHVAMLLNGNLLPKNKQSVTILKENDRVDLITFAGGG